MNQQVDQGGITQSTGGFQQTPQSNQDNQNAQESENTENNSQEQSPEAVEQKNQDALQDFQNSAQMVDRNTKEPEQPVEKSEPAESQEQPKVAHSGIGNTEAAKEIQQEQENKNDQEQSTNDVNITNDKKEDGNESGDGNTQESAATPEVTPQTTEAMGSPENSSTSEPVHPEKNVDPSTQEQRVFSPDEPWNYIVAPKREQDKTLSDQVVHPDPITPIVDPNEILQYRLPFESLGIEGITSPVTAKNLREIKRIIVLRDGDSALMKSIRGLIGLLMVRTKALGDNRNTAIAMTHLEIAKDFIVKEAAIRDEGDISQETKEDIEMLDKHTNGPYAHLK